MLNGMSALFWVGYAKATVFVGQCGETAHGQCGLREQRPIRNKREPWKDPVMNDVTLFRRSHNGGWRVALHVRVHTRKDTPTVPCA
jgi:hypothetical protein